MNCTYKDGTFCLITELAYQKCHKENMLETYPYLEVGKQLCHIHYCKVVEPNRGNIQYKRKKELKDQKGCKKRIVHEESHSVEENSIEGNIININYKNFLLISNFINLFYLVLINDSTFASNVKLLTNVLYNKQRRESANLELDPIQFQHMIEEANPELIGFFSSMVNAIIPKDRSAYNKQEAKKSIVALCYMISGLRNKFVNQFKIEIGLYLAASGATWEAIDTLSSLGYSACVKTVMDFQKKIQANHIIKIDNHFLEKVVFFLSYVL